MARREKQTLIPAFDPEELAKELETANHRPTLPPPFDPASYARIVDAHVSLAADTRDAPPTMTAVRSHAVESVESMGRAMYGCYLASDFPEALVLAERVLEQQPDHALAQAVLERCRARLAPPVKASSVLRLRQSPDTVVNGLAPMSASLLRHVDGVVDAATVAARSGIAETTALDHMHALVDLGVLEVVAG